ncbi:DUF397 domain-containing protein [Streptomyces sp. NBC_01775]|uniref:DUF397 domain-containing protein n=1 Tax=Streptomyces sp. NBC_01775 TaxID=2975939 RepID=UPI002DD8E0BC|nr:DUF397 domain-containing protein [Streptomyces sp. NBC_01775]WSB79573.1 DUF397 domain-containing protein [Streptomyces sp. NBC_01775]
MNEAQWVKSSYSDGQGGNCVEWAPDLMRESGAVPVRDSKDIGRAPVVFSRAAWAAFVGGVKSAAC